MSTHDYPSGTTLGGKLGCLAAALVGLPIFGAAEFLWFYGDCFDSERCHQGEAYRWIVVILLTVAVAAPVGLLTRKLVNARKRT